MKEQSLPSSPLTGAERVILPAPYLVGQTCRFAPIKKLPCHPMLPSKNPHEPNSFLGIQPPHGVLHFLSLLTCDHPWFKKDLAFKAFLKGFKAI
jgi:hypothetical protein